MQIWLLQYKKKLAKGRPGERAPEELTQSGGGGGAPPRRRDRRGLQGQRRDRRGLQVRSSGVTAAERRSMGGGGATGMTTKTCRGEDLGWAAAAGEEEGRGGDGDGREKSPETRDGIGGQPAGVVLWFPHFSLAVWGGSREEEGWAYIHRGHRSRFIPPTGTVDPSVPVGGTNRDQWPG
jgi:hypothetical protein